MAARRKKTRASKKRKLSGAESTEPAKKKAKLSDEPSEIVFDDFPDFRPNLTPKQIFERGSFQDQGGYFRPIQSMHFKSELRNAWKEFTAKGQCLEGVAVEKLVAPKGLSQRALNGRNRYGVRAGSSLSDWEGKRWISAQDPYGWVQWYCRFTDGRRTDDDERQIRRWKNFAGLKGRWKRFLLNKIVRANAEWDDEKISPVTRQNLQHWAYQLTEKDVEDFKH